MRSTCSPSPLRPVVGIRYPFDLPEEIDHSTPRMPGRGPLRVWLTASRIARPQGKGPACPRFRSRPAFDTGTGEREGGVPPPMRWRSRGGDGLVEHQRLERNEKGLGGNDDLPQNSLRARAPRNSLIINAEVISHNHFPPTRPEKRFSPLISRHRTRVTGLQ